MKRLLFILFFLVVCSNAEAKPIITDLSEREIRIQTAFQGANLMIFGARNDPGDIVVIVRGPEKNAIVRQKKRVSGVWVNRHSEYFGDIPGFYAIASSRPMEEIQKSIYFPLIGVGEDNVLGGSATDETQVRKDFRRALLRDLRRRHLFYQNSEAFSLISETLFKTAVPFPDTTPPGLYTAEVYLISDGEVAASHMTPIRVFKTGVDAAIYELAHRQPYAYGLFAVFVALAAGWFAAAAFNRR